MQGVRGDDFVSVREAATDLKVTTSTVRRWIAGGDLPAYRVGTRRIVVKRTNVLALIASARQHPEKAGDMAQLESEAIRTLSENEKERARIAIEAARQLRAELLARRGGVQYSPSWELLNEVRDLRSRQQRSSRPAWAARAIGAWKEETRDLNPLAAIAGADVSLAAQRPVPRRCGRRACMDTD